ncbi:MAG: DinB family protein [Caldilineaceae bacterium]
MELAYHLDLLLKNAERIRCLVEGMSDQDARWKPDAESWSILEVINHLADEEEADFIAPRLHAQPPHRSLAPYRSAGLGHRTTLHRTFTG